MSENIDKVILNTIMKYSSDTVYFKDVNSKFIWNSLGHAKQVGLADPRDMLGKSDFDFFPAKFAQAARDSEKEIMLTKKPILNIEETLETPDGEKIYFLASKYPLFDENDKVVGTWGMSKEITELKRMEKELERSNLKLQRLARVDDLTGLYNRRYFYEILEKTFALYQERDVSKKTFALITIDVDNLKLINDAYGHPRGDDALRMVASALVTATSKTDTCFRVGGDEFMVMTQDCTPESASALATKLMSAVSAHAIPMSKDKFEKISISVGVASYKEGRTLSELISEADKLLYKSKRNGKNQVSSSLED